MTLEEKLRKLIEEQRKLHNGSHSDVVLAREMILRLVENLLSETETDLILEEYSK